MKTIIQKMNSARVRGGRSKRFRFDGLDVYRQSFVRALKKGKKNQKDYGKAKFSREVAWLNATANQPNTSERTTVRFTIADSISFGVIYTRCSGRNRGANSWNIQDRTLFFICVVYGGGKWILRRYQTWRNCRRQSRINDQITEWGTMV